MVQAKNIITMCCQIDASERGKKSCNHFSPWSWFFSLLAMVENLKTVVGGPHSYDLVICSYYEITHVHCFKMEHCIFFLTTSVYISILRYKLKQFCVINLVIQKHFACSITTLEPQCMKHNSYWFILCTKVTKTRCHKNSHHNTSCREDSWTLGHFIKATFCCHFKFFSHGCRQQTWLSFGLDRRHGLVLGPDQGILRRKSQKLHLTKFPSF